MAATVRVRMAPYELPSLSRRVAEAAAACAEDDIGKGEELENNQGPYVWSLTGRKTRGAWCAAAVFTWMSGGADAVGAYMSIRRTHGARKLARLIAEHGRWVGPRGVPRRGDVALWSRGAKGLWKGHVGIVVSVAGEYFTTVEGNRGKFPAMVKPFEHVLGERKLLGFARY